MAHCRTLLSVSVGHAIFNPFHLTFSTIFHISMVTFNILVAPN